MGVTTVVLIVAGSVAGLVLLVVMVSVITRRVAAASRQLIEKAYAANAVVLSDDMANSFGIESQGPIQLRGNGGLVLTNDVFHFMPLAGAREVKVPLTDVTNVEIVRSHLGKTVGRPLVKVHYKQNDKTDAVALFVRDPSAWKHKIEELRGAYR